MFFSERNWTKNIYVSEKGFGVCNNYIVVENNIIGVGFPLSNKAMKRKHVDKITWRFRSKDIRFLMYSIAQRTWKRNVIKTELENKNAVVKSHHVCQKRVQSNKMAWKFYLNKKINSFPYLFSLLFWLLLSFFFFIY